MRNSAALAKARLSRTRLSFPEWHDRVRQFLALGGRSASEFPNYPWRTWHAAGLAAGHVAEVILSIDGVRDAEGQLKRLVG